MNANTDPWSEECYLKADCTEQGNPCQANDVNLLGAFLADSSGNPIPICFGNQTIEVYLWGTFTNGTNTDRYAVRSRTEVWLDGMMDTELNSCSFDVLPPGTQDLALLGVFSYTCGQQIQLVNTWIAWETSAASCSDVMAANYIGECGDYAPSKCSKSLEDTINFLSPNFLYTCGEITMASTEVCFMNMTTGGNPPLTYNWDFGDGGMSTAEDTCYTYNASTGSFNVVLTVTDANGVQAAAQFTVNLDSLNCCELTITCPDPDGGTFSCVDDVPAQDPNAVTILDSCFMAMVVIEDDTTGTGCGLDTMFITRNYYVSDMVTTDTCIQVYTVVDDEGPDVSACTALDLTINCQGADDNMAAADAWHSANLDALSARDDVGRRAVRQQYLFDAFG